MERPPETVRILRIAAGGDGVARLADGRVVFVPRTAPGDLVALAGIQDSARYARARVGSLLEAGPARTEPACPHYGRDDCGGCQLQHLQLPAQREAKRVIVGDALRRIARLDTADPEIIPAPEAWAYRSRITLARGPDGFGLHHAGRPDRVFPLESCLITDAGLMEVWRVLRTLLRRLPPDAGHLVLRRDRTGHRHVVVQTAGERVWAGGPDLAETLRESGLPVTVWWHPRDGAPRVVGGGASPYPATVFEQVNPAMGDRVRRYAVDQAGPLEGRHAWDLYAGTGETTLMLLEAGATVDSVELDPRAVLVAEREIRTSLGAPPPGPLPQGVQLYTGRAEALTRSLAPPAVVIANPPRAGMEAAVVGALLERNPVRLVYVSCDPATLARDLRRLAAAFRLAAVRSFGLFPQSALVETVVSLE
ncbi:MAG: class I SAM-dependent RNA methyltransferase, partial [Gemmatimonadales bacterium]